MRFLLSALISLKRHLQELLKSTKTNEEIEAYKKERQQKALTIKGKDRDILELRKRYETANNLKEKDCLSVYFEKVEGLNKEERLFYTFY